MLWRFAVGVVLRALADPEWHVRRAAGKTLARLVVGRAAGRVAAINGACRLLLHPEARQRDAGVEALRVVHSVSTPTVDI
ncbi:hypothetical protein T484DRAFT_1767947 [Baffinella frigidus]|nr:hypothetical protein T484DRAFT_1767947 [Cryptophyta sp. CCMP2293]